MKTTSLRPGTGLVLAVVVGGLLAMSPGLCRAGDQAATAARQVRAESGKAQKPCCACAKVARNIQETAPEKVTLTGSYIPQNVKPCDANTVSPFPVTVISRKMIEASGAATLSGVLRKTVVGAR